MITSSFDRLKMSNVANLGHLTWDIIRSVNVSKDRYDLIRGKLFGVIITLLDASCIAVLKISQQIQILFLFSEFPQFLYFIKDD